MEKIILSSADNAKGETLLKVRIPSEAFDEVLDRAFLREKEQLALPEEEKATRALAEARLGADYFYPAAAQIACAEALDELIEEQRLDLADDPEITECETKTDGLYFTVLCLCWPQVTLGEYRGLSPELEKPTVTEKELESTLRMFARSVAETTELDRPAAEGDLVTLDMEGTIDGASFPGGSAEDYQLTLGNHILLPALEAGIIGMKAGEEKQIPVTFPQDYAQGLGGKHASFRIALKKVCRVKMPEVDEAFAQQYFQMSMDELKADLRVHQLENKMVDWQAAREDAAIDMAAQRMSATFSEKLVQNAADQMLSSLGRQLAQNGQTLADYAQAAQTDEATLRKNALAAAELKMRQELVVRAILQKEALTVDEAFQEKALETLAQRYGTTVDSLRANLQDEMMQKELLRMRALEVILAPLEE